MALKNEERAQLEARLARRKAVETTKEQQEAERKMLISANGMRAQREQLQGELSRLAEQQHKLETELQAQRDRASHAEREAERAMEEARIALEQKEHEMELRVQTMEEQRLEQQRKARAMAHELEEEKRQMSDTLAQEKEKRIEHTKEMAIRRFAKRELSKGWVAWKDAHQERLRLQRALKAAGNKMLRPKFVACFQTWQRMWEAENHARAKMSLAERYEQEVKERQEVQVALDSANAQLEQLRREMREGRGQEAELQRQMQEQLEREKEKRIEHTKEMAMRRILKRDLSRGWMAWHGVWSEKRRQQNMLRAAGARLTKPKLVACMRHWRTDWETDMQHKATMSIEQRLKAEVEELTEELKEARKQIAAAKSAGYDGGAAEEEMRRKLEEQLALEREKRIEHTKEMAVRRIAKRNLFRGWSAWVEPYLEKKRRMRMLQAAASRLTKPKVVAGFKHWYKDWQDEALAKASMSVAQKYAEEVKINQEMSAQLTKLTKELDEARTAMREGRGQEAELHRQMQEELEREKEKRIEHTKEMAMRRILKRDLSRGWMAWHGGWFEKRRRDNVKRAAGARLAKPKVVASFKHWHTDWQSETQHKATMSIEGRLNAEIYELKKELESTKKALAKAVGDDLELSREMEEKLAAEKEKRIQHTQQMAVRRIGKRDLTRGWVAWSEEFFEQRRRKNMLKAAAARLTKPKVVACLKAWRESWEEKQGALKMLTLEGRMKEQIRVLTQELEEARRAMIEGKGFEAERERLLQEQLEAEKEKRIEHTKMMAIRRIGKRDLARGWTAWLEPYLENKRRMRMLMAAGAKLSKPKVVASFSHWRKDWEADTFNKANMSIADQLGVQVKETQTLWAELQACRKELEEARQAMLEGRGLEAEKERQLLDRLAKEKEARMEHTKEMAVRRIARRDLARGWTGWLEPYLEAKRRQRMLQQAGARLTKPKVMASFAHWRKDWEGEQHDKETLSITQLYHREIQQNKDSHSQILKLTKQLNEARQAMAEGRGQEEELKRRMEEQLEREREKRIEHTKDMALNRIMKRDLSRGWTAWFDGWYEHRRQQNMLKAAGARLTKPKVIASFKLWHTDWQVEVQHQATLGMEGRLNAQIRDLKQQLLDSKKELKEVKLATGYEAPTEADLKRQLEQKLKEEKEKRIQRTQEMAVHRIGKRDLTRGWVAWYDLWAEAAQQRRLLKQAGAKLLKPKVVSSFQHWRRDFEAAELERQSQSMSQRLAQEVEERKRLQRQMATEVQALKDQLEEARKAALEGRGLEAEMQRQLEERLAEEREKRIEHTKQMAIRRIGKRDLSRGWVAWFDMYSQVMYERRLLQQAGNKLTKPKVSAAWTAWQKDWKRVELEKMKTQSMSVEERLREQLVQAKKELEAMKKLQSGKADVEAEMKRLMDEKLAAEKEKRIQHTQEMAVRRIAKRDLTRGWLGWYEPYAEEKRVKNMLKAAAARLAKPKVVAAMGKWKDDWTVEEQHRINSELKAKASRNAREGKKAQRALEEAKAEAEELRAKAQVAPGSVSEDEIARLMEEKLEAERQKRIQHTQEMAVRRIAKRDLTRGWLGWYEPYAEEKRVKNMLKAAAARLAKPKVVAAMGKWKDDWTAEELAKTRKELEEKALASMADAESANSELATLRRELAMAKSKLEAAGIEFSQSASAAEEKAARELEERLEAEKEKRIEHTQQMAIKRIVKRDLARGWVGWLDMYLEQRRRTNMLKAAASRLAKPKLVAACAKWKEDWSTEEQAKLAKMHKVKASRAIRDAEKNATELEKLRKEHEELKQATLEGRGLEQLERDQLKATLEKEREQRVEHTKQMAVNRIMKRDLSRGWTAWYDGWYEQRRQKNLLKAAASRLAKPKLVACHKKWKDDWAAEEQVKFAKKHQMTSARALRDAEANKKALDKALKELEDLRQATLEGRGLEQLEKEQLKMQLEAEKEKRIEHTKDMAIKRFMKRDLARGWTAWHDTWYEQRRKQNMLKAAASRLLKPKVVAACKKWKEDWTRDLQVKYAQKHSKNSNRAIRDAEKNAKELEKALLELEELRQAVASGRGLEAQKERALKEQLEAEKEKRIEHTKDMALHRIMKRDLSRGWIAWLDVWEQHHRRKNLLKAAAARLTKPKVVASMRHWKADWEAVEADKKTMSFAEQLREQKKETDRVWAELQKTTDELQAARRAMLEGRGAEEEQQRLLELRLEREKEKRIEHTKEMAIRRVLRRDLARGWTAWLEPYLERKHRMRQLQQAGARLLKPKLAKSFQLWSKTVMQLKAKTANMSVEERLGVKSREFEELKADFGKLQRELDDQKQLDSVALKNERKAVAELQKEIKELLDEKAAEKRNATLALAKEEKANEQMGKKDVVLKQAQEMLAEQQAQAARHLEEQLAKSRDALEKELKASHATIEDLRGQIAKLQADAIRAAHSGRIELQRPSSGGRPPSGGGGRRKSIATKGILGDVNFDETKPLGPQLKECLSKHAIRVLDLFREWDTNGDGEISKKEFRQAMPKLGMEVPDDVANALFDGYDVDGSGVMDFKELQKMLREGPSKGDPVKALKTKPPGAKKGKWQQAAEDVTETTMDPSAAKALKALGAFGKK